ncbi:MAG: glutamate--tRNA ligase, partial [Clostridia bacterium]
MKETRTRYAPSPTGYMHIGNLRTALYEYLIAKADGGKFILRIEDTDQKRYVEGATEVIYRTLETIGLKHDEGPDIGGPYGPYVQSERKSTYLPLALQLVEKGCAYHCFCSHERLEALRSECEGQGVQPKYDRHCLGLKPTEVEARIKNGDPFVIRQKMPSTGETRFTDRVYGEIVMENATLEDQVLIKSDGFPTYNFANVVDDHAMNITHVVRGSEYITSTPKYILLYEAFGWELPVYVHLPVVVKEGGKKISKRTGDATVEDLLEEGYLVPALINYICLLGWSPGDEREFFTLEELVREFDVGGISRSPSTFDYDKLNWMSGEYIRRMSPGEFLLVCRPWLLKTLDENAFDFTKIAAVLQKRIEVLGEIPEAVSFLNRVEEYDKTLYENKKMKSSHEQARMLLPIIQSVLSGLEQWDHDMLVAALTGIAQR